MQMLADQCALLKVIAENQEKLAKIMKAGPSLNFPPPGVPPHRPNGPGVGSSPTRLASMYHAVAGSQASPATPPAPAFMGFCATAVANLWVGYQAVVAPAIAVEPNAAQEVPNKDTRPIDVIDENGAPRTVSPSPKGPDQVRGLIAQGCSEFL